MTKGPADTSFESDAVAKLMRAADLRVDENRLDETAGLLEAAAEAAIDLDEAAARIPLGEALAEFDPAWREGER